MTDHTNPDDHRGETPTGMHGDAEDDSMPDLDPVPTESRETLDEPQSPPGREHDDALDEPELPDDGNHPLGTDGGATDRTTR